MTTLRLLSAACAVALLAGAAHAQEVRVGGNVVQNTAVGSATNMALGAGAQARTSINTITDSQLGGNVKSNVYVKSVTNIATAGKQAGVAVGTTDGVKRQGDTERNVYVKGNIVNVDSCLTIAADGNNPTCD